MQANRPLRLFPLPVEEISGVYADFGETLRGVRWPNDRPYTVINMVSTVDGKATIGGRAGGIGGEADRDAMRNLRAWSDAVMIGAGTLRAEKLSLGVSESLAERREAIAKTPQPLAVILSSSGDVPLDNLIHTSRENLVLVASKHESARDGSEVASLLHARPGDDGRPDLRSTVSALSSEFGVDRLLVEGGPTLNHSLVEQDLVDEFLITLSPRIVGGERGQDLTAVEGEPKFPNYDLKLSSIHLADGYLFLRYTKHAK